MPSGPNPAVDSPTPPKSLRGEGLAEWKRIVPQLLELGLLTRIDRSALVKYCRAWAESERLEEWLDQNGTVYDTPQGLVCSRPEVKQRDAADARVHRYLSEFGLSPGSRTKASAVPPPKDDTGAGEFFH